MPDFSKARGATTYSSRLPNVIKGARPHHHKRQIGTRRQPSSHSIQRSKGSEIKLSFRIFWWMICTALPTFRNGFGFGQFLTAVPLILLALKKPEVTYSSPRTLYMRIHFKQLALAFTAHQCREIHGRESILLLQQISRTYEGSGSLIISNHTGSVAVICLCWSREAEHINWRTPWRKWWETNSGFK